MKNLKFKFVALLLATASTLMYIGCKTSITGGLYTNTPDRSSLQGGTWVHAKSIIDYFDASGKLIYTENATNAARFRFDDRTVSVSVINVYGFIDNDLYNFTRTDFGDSRHQLLEFRTYAPGGNPDLAVGGYGSVGVKLARGTESGINFLAPKVSLSKLTDTDLTMLSDQKQAFEFTPKGTTTKIQAASAFITIYYKKEKQIGD